MYHSYNPNTPHVQILTPHTLTLALVIQFFAIVFTFLHMVYEMFRHTTKQKGRSQEELARTSAKEMNASLQVHCDDIYSQTYERRLHRGSVDMLNCIVGAMTGGKCTVDPDRRMIFSILRISYGCTLTLRACFVQPEICSATATLPARLASRIQGARKVLDGWKNNPSPGKIAVTKAKCQVIGRASPYVVEEALCEDECDWTYCHASRSRLFYVVCSIDGTRVMSPTAETLNIYQGFSTDTCAMVYLSGMRCHRITAQPLQGGDEAAANKSTCVCLYQDGTTKIQGTPYKAGPACKAFRDLVQRCHMSSARSRVLNSLTPMQ